MVDPEDKKEDSFEFDSAGEAVEYISMATARVLAMRAAREEPGNYGAAFEGIQMVFEVVSSEQDPEDEGSRYHLRLSYRPEGNFQGQSGVEEFILTDVGEMEIRQVLSWPVEKSVTRNASDAPQPVESRLEFARDNSEERIAEKSVPRFTNWTPYAEQPWRNAPRLPGVVETRNSNTKEHTFIGSATGGTGIQGYIERRDPVDNWDNLSGYEKELSNPGGTLEVRYAVADSKEQAEQQRNLLIHKYREEQGRLPLGQRQTPRLCPRGRSGGCSICKE